MLLLYFFLMGLLMFLLGMGGFMLYVLFGTWNPRKILRQKRWAKEFAQEVGVDLPSGFVVQKSDDELSSGHFWLKYPYWERPKADGTRDRRLSNNNIIRPLSTLMFSHWKIEGHDPWEMYCLVQQMRKKGQRISLCKEELEKKRRCRSSSVRPRQTLSLKSSLAMRSLLLDSSTSAPTFSGSSGTRLK